MVESQCNLDAGLPFKKTFFYKEINATFAADFFNKPIIVRAWKIWETQFGQQQYCYFS